MMRIDRKPKCAAIVGGQIGLDIIPDMTQIDRELFARLFKPGRVVQVGKSFLCTGGAVSNTGLALYQFGIDTALVCMIGDDIYGEIVLSFLRERSSSLTKNVIIAPGKTTAYSIIINPDGVDRIFLYNPGANDDLSADDIREDAGNKPGLFHFGYPPMMLKMVENNGLELRKLFRKMKKAGLTTSLDLCFPDPFQKTGRMDWKTILKHTLPLVDFFEPSIEELLFMWNNDLFAKLSAQGDILDQVDDAMLMDLSAELLALGTAAVMIKLGHHGLFLRTSDESRLREAGFARPSDIPLWAGRTIRHPIFRVNVRGTTGAGDSSIAGFLSALLRDFSPEAAVEMAAAAGACCVEQPDALSGLMPWEDLLARIDSGWEKLSA